MMPYAVSLYCPHTIPLILTFRPHTVLDHSHDVPMLYPLTLPMPSLRCPCIVPTFSPLYSPTVPTLPSAIPTVSPYCPCDIPALSHGTRGRAAKQNPFHRIGLNGALPTHRPGDEPHPLGTLWEGGHQHHFPPQIPKVCASPPYSPPVTSRRSACGCRATRSASPTACWGCRSRPAPGGHPSDPPHYLKATK